MAEARRINRVHRSLSRPLTILGAERKLFFFAMCLGAATFNLLNSLLGGLMIFLLLYLMPGDPLFRMLQDIPRLRAEDYERLRKLYGFDDPVYIQYWKWL